MKLAIIASHPIQYYDPLFRGLANHAGISLKVFYLCHPKEYRAFDPQFARTVEWDGRMLEGYEHVFVRNRAWAKSQNRMTGMFNPGLFKELTSFRPSMIIVTSVVNLSNILVRGYASFSGVEVAVKGDSTLIRQQKSLKNYFKIAIRKCWIGRKKKFLYCGRANKYYWRSVAGRQNQLFFFFYDAEMSIPQDAVLSDQKQNNRFCFLFVGKMIDKKRPVQLLRAFARLTGKNIELHVVGTGALMEECEELAKKDPRVRLEGFVNQSSLARYYARADCLVVPSRGRFETWGLVMNEYRNWGNFIVASTDVGGAWDLILEGKDGIKFWADSEKALEKALRTTVAMFSADRVPKDRVYCERTNYSEAIAGIERLLRHS